MLSETIAASRGRACYVSGGMFSTAQETRPLPARGGGTKDRGLRTARTEGRAKRRGRPGARGTALPPPRSTCLPRKYSGSTQGGGWPFGSLPSPARDTGLRASMGEGKGRMEAAEPGSSSHPASHGRAAKGRPSPPGCSRLRPKPALPYLALLSVMVLGSRLVQGNRALLLSLQLVPAGQPPFTISSAWTCASPPA